MLTLSEAEQALKAARADAASDPGRLAEALVACAERLPMFRYRSEPVRELLLEATQLLPPLGRPELEVRCLLRLAEVRMLEGALEQAAQLAQQAAKRAETRGDEAAVLRARCIEVRVLSRRGESEAAKRLFAEAAARTADFDSLKSHVSSDTYIGVMLAMADEPVERTDEAAIPILRGLLNELDRSRIEAIDARFAAHQGIALVAELLGKLETALIHLRAAVALVKSHDAPLDLLECRLALGTALTAARKTPEARRVLQAVIDAARDLGAEQHRLLGLTALSTVLSDQGAVRGAVDAAIQSASGHAKQGNLLGYVRGVTLAAHTLLKHKREAAGVEMLMYGVSVLRHKVGEDASRLMQVQLDAIREEFGEAKYERVCQEILDLRAARKRLAGGPQ